MKSEVPLYKSAKNWTLNGFNAPLILNIKLYCVHLTLKGEHLLFKRTWLFEGKKKKEGEIKASVAPLMKFLSAFIGILLSAQPTYQRNRWPKKAWDDSPFLHKAATVVDLNLPPLYQMYQAREKFTLASHKKNKKRFHCHKQKIIGNHFFLWPLNAHASAWLGQINHCLVMNPLMCRQQSRWHLRATCTISASSDSAPRWRGSCTSVFLPSVQLRDNGKTVMSYKPIMEAFSPSGLIWQSPHWWGRARLHSVVSHSQERLNVGPVLTETD